MSGSPESAPEPASVVPARRQLESASAAPARRRLGHTSVVVLALAVAVAVALSWMAAAINSRDEHRLLQLQATDAAVSIASLVSQIENSLGSIGSVAAATDGNPAALQKLGTEGGMDTFSSVAVLRTESSRITDVLPVKGTPVVTPLLASLTAGGQAALEQAITHGGLRVVGFLGHGSARVLLVALGEGGTGGSYAVWGEVPLPEGTVTPSPYPKLNFATYVGPSRSSDVLFASTTHVPLGGDRVDVQIDLVTADIADKPQSGDPTLLFEVSATSSLLTAQALALPWILACAALFTGLMVAYAVESAARRRDLAVAVAKDLATKNAELDQALARSVEAEQARQELEADLRRAQRLEAVGQLAGGVAHDFNNLLMVIQSHLGFLTESLPRDEAIQSDLAEIRSAADRAGELTRRLLVFSRRDLVRPSVLDVNGTIADVLNLLRRSVGEDVTLSLDADPELPRVLCDAGELHQVLVNLVVNARQAIEGPGSITVTTGTDDLDETAVQAHADVVPGRYARISVSDTGAGMSPETMERVFEPYFTTKEAGSGTGLGLSTVYGIVRRYLGYTTVESVVGEGSIVSVYLPATDRLPEVPPPPPQGEVAPVPEASAAEASAAEASAAEASAAEASAAEASAAEGRKVLLVEDEDGVRRACRRILEGAGYEVAEASCAAEALEGFDPAVFDIVVTDVVMPGELSGRDLVREIQAMRPDLPALYMSGYSRDAIAKRGVLEEGITVVEKPFAPAELLAKVGAVLAGAAAAGTPAG